MSAEHDTPIKTPKQLITVVVLAFIVPIIIIVLLVKFVGASKRTGAGTQAMAAQAVEARIRPVAGFELIDASAPRALKTGEQIYTAQCSACHAAGVAGAPKTGDAAALSPDVSDVDFGNVPRGESRSLTLFVRNDGASDSVLGVEELGRDDRLIVDRARRRSRHQDRVRLRWARVTATYISRRSSSILTAGTDSVADDSRPGGGAVSASSAFCCSPRCGSTPSSQPTTNTCANSSPLAA